MTIATVRLTGMSDFSTLEASAEDIAREVRKAVAGIPEIGKAEAERISVIFSNDRMVAGTKGAEVFVEVFFPANPTIRNTYSVRSNLEKVIREKIGRRCQVSISFDTERNYILSFDRDEGPTTPEDNGTHVAYEVVPLIRGLGSR